MDVILPIEPADKRKEQRSAANQQRHEHTTADPGVGFELTNFADPKEGWNERPDRPVHRSMRIQIQSVIS